MPAYNERSPQGSNLPANTFGPSPTAMGELTPPGLVSYPAVPAGGVLTDDTMVKRTGPNGLGSSGMGPYKP